GRIAGAGEPWRADLGGDVPGGDLVAQHPERVGTGPDPDEPGFNDGLGELGVLGEEAVPGMHGVGAGLRCCREQLADVEVALPWRDPTERNRFVRDADVRRLKVRLGVPRNAADARVLACASNAYGD